MSWCTLGTILSFGLPASAWSQGTAPLSLAEARENARRVSPALVASREAVNAARARERQAGAYPNPSLSYSREQTSGSGQSNSQNVASLDQAVELGKLRDARRDAARARREAAEARLAIAQADLDHEVARAYALAIAGGRQVAIAERTSAAFAEALRVGQQRLAAGDIAGYAQRRLRLEGARYATSRAEAVLSARAARVALASLVSAPDAVLQVEGHLTDSLALHVPTPAPDSLTALALRARAELRALSLEAEVAAAEARLVAHERTPIPVLSAGFKNERQETAGVSHGLSGFVAGISLPLPLFDRRAGAMEAAQADVRRRHAEVEVMRRRVAREVRDAHDAYRAAQEQVALLAPSLGDDARAALRAAQVAYVEGEITQAEWLDVVRAYRDAEMSLAALQGELSIRRAALERAVGIPLSGISR